jgi:hypothetical protein
MSFPFLKLFLKVNWINISPHHFYKNIILNKIGYSNFKINWVAINLSGTEKDDIEEPMTRKL